MREEGRFHINKRNKLLTALLNWSELKKRARIRKRHLLKGASMKFKHLGFALASSIFLMGPVSAQTATSTTVRIAVPPAVLVSIQPWVADKLGLWAKAGLKSEYVSAAGASLLQIVATNSADVTLLDVGGAAAGLANKAFDTVFVAGIFKQMPGQILCLPGAVPKGLSGKPLIEHLSKLKMGTTGRGAGTDTFHRMELHEAGVAPIEANILPVGGTPNLIAAIQSKSVDCISANLPISLLLGNKAMPVIDYLKREGATRLHTNYLHTGFVFDRKRAYADPDFTKKVGLVLREASSFISNPKNNEALTDMLNDRFVGLSRDDLSNMLKQSANAFSWGVTEAQMKNGIDIYNILNPSKQVKIDPASLIFDPLRAELKAAAN